MRLAMLVNPATDHNLQLAAQVGVTDIVAVYPGLEADRLLDLRRRVEAFGMRLTHIERKIPHLKFVHNLPGRDKQIADFQQLIRNMGAAGLEVLCYNWMPDEDWQRTSSTVVERGGALVTAFDINQIGENVTDADGRPDRPTPAEQLWDNLAYFLEQVLPVAEQEGVRLAIHPDDPPLPALRGQSRIIISNEALRRVVELAPSPSNGVCYCSGSLVPAGEDPLEGVRMLGDKIFFAHMRNTVGRGERFRESFHDNGDTWMPDLLRAYAEIGYQGAIRPDHAPSLAGESNETPGYEMLGRLYAAGYLRGLMQSAAGRPTSPQ